MSRATGTMLWLAGLAVLLAVAPHGQFPLESRGTIRTPEDGHVMELVPASALFHGTE